MLKKIRLLLGFLILSLAFVFTTNLASASIGISPGWVIVDDMLPNTTVEREIFIVRGQPEKTEYVSISFRGEAADYVSVDYGSDEDYLTLPEGVEQVSVTVIINSGSLMTGTYEALLDVNPVDVGEVDFGSDGEIVVGSRVVLGVEGNILFSVSNDEKEEYAIESVHVDDTEVFQDFGFYYDMNNTGNVDTRPNRIELEITSDDDPTFLYSESFEASQIPLVKSFSVETVNMLTEASLAEGNYYAYFDFYDRDEELIFSDSLFFQVHPEGTLLQEGEIISFESDKKAYEPGELVNLITVFENIGEVGLTGILSIEVFFEEKRIDEIVLDEVYVPSLKSVEFEANYSPLEEGTYQAIATVSYGIYETEPVSIEFRVGGLVINYYYIVGAFLLLLLLLLLLLFLLKRRKKDEESEENNLLFPGLHSDDSKS